MSQKNFLRDENFDRRVTEHHHAGRHHPKDSPLILEMMSCHVISTGFGFFGREPLVWRSIRNEGKIKVMYPDLFNVIAQHIVTVALFILYSNI